VIPQGVGVVRAGDADADGGGTSSGSSDVPDADLRLVAGLDALYG
jgi:hypothetical protein